MKSNMNSVKRALAVALALVMMVSIMTLSAFATATSNVVPVEEHPYNAFQILKGEIDANGNLTKAEWGNGINVSQFISAYNAVVPDNMKLAADALGSDFAMKMKDVAEDSELARKVAKAAYASKTSPIVENVSDGDKLGDSVPAGYYLMVDNSNTPEKNLAQLKMYDKKTGINISNKVNAPSMTKKVKDINDTTGVETRWQDGADYDIGDYVPFQLKAQLGIIKDYETYAVEFKDNLSTGLTFVNDDAHPVKVMVDGVDKTSYFSVKQSGQNVSIYCWDVKAAGAADNSVIEVTFFAQLNENADIGRDGNDNVASLIYSCNPNESSKPSDTSNPPSETPDGPPTSETPEDKVTVFTYALKVSKVDQDNRPLEGATFTLEKVGPNNTKTSVGDAVVEGNVFSWVGLDDGTYILTETEAPENYNKIDPVTFTVTADHTTVEISKDVIDLNNLKTDQPTLIQVCSLNDAVMSGYMLATVINQFGATLPSTGGDGMSTAFYAVGGLMVLGAAVVLFSKRKASSK